MIQRYRCVLERADDDGKVGVKIGKELMNVAGRALKMHIKTLAPLVLPLSEKLVYIVNYIKRKVRMSAADFPAQEEGDLGGP